MEYLLAALYKERMGKGSGERGGRGNGSVDHKIVGWRNEWGIVGSELGNGVSCEKTMVQIEEAKQNIG